MVLRSRGLIIGLVIALSLVLLAFNVQKKNEVFGDRLELTPVVNVQEFGAKGDGVTDDQRSIVKAIAYAKSNNFTVYFPSGHYKHSDIIVLDGVQAYGDGFTSILDGTDPAHTAIKLTGNNSSIKDVRKTTSNVVKRRSNRESANILIDNADYFIVERVLSEQCAGAGILSFTGKNGKILENKIQNTLADGIHMTHGSEDISVVKNTVYNSGDDMIAVVSYVVYGSKCKRITIDDNECDTQVIGRGISVVGGDNVSITNNKIKNCYSAGIYIYSEDSYNTYGCEDISIINNIVENSGNATVPMASLHVGGRKGYETKNISSKNNIFKGCRYRGAAVTKMSSFKSLSDTFNSVIGQGIFLLEVTDFLIEVTDLNTAGNGGIYADRLCAGQVLVKDNTPININTINRKPVRLQAETDF